MAVRFVSGATSVYVQNPELGNRYVRQKANAMGRSAGGNWYSYSKGVGFKTLRLAWKNLRDDERIALENFFYTTVDGPNNTFTFTDHDTTAWTARFTQDSLSFEAVDDQRNTTTTYTLGALTYPTTTRQKTVWSTEIELEVS